MNLHYQSQNLACCRVTPVPRVEIRAHRTAFAPEVGLSICGRRAPPMRRRGHRPGQRKELDPPAVDPEITGKPVTQAGVPSDPNANMCSMLGIGDKAIVLHREGLRSIEIAHRLGVAQSTVHYHLRKLADEQLVVRRVTSDRSRAAIPANLPRSTKVPTREHVADLTARGMTRADIARQLGLTKSVVSYHARRLGEPFDDRCRRRYDWALVQSFYDDGNSLRECQRAFGFSSGSWHDAVRRGLIVPRPGFRPGRDLRGEHPAEPGAPKAAVAPPGPKGKPL